MRSLTIAVCFALGACSSKGADAPPAAAPLACGELAGENPVQTEMRQLECALQQAIAAIGRDDLAVIPEWMHLVHAAKQHTEHALHSGSYRLPNGDLAAFAAMDETFHGALEALAEAAGSGDHAATATAVGQALAQCQGCHATFRPVKPSASRPHATHSSHE